MEGRVFDRVHGGTGGRRGGRLSGGRDVDLRNLKARARLVPQGLTEARGAA
jgi:hypothetical protein